MVVDHGQESQFLHNFEQNIQDHPDTLNIPQYFPEKIQFLYLLFLD